MLIPFGILSASAVGSDYELIESQILGSTTTSVSFSSLGTYANIYKHLQLRLVLRASEAVQESNYFLRFNSDTTNGNYAYHALFGNGSSVNAFASTGGGIVFPIAGANQTASSFGVGVLDILDAYSSTKNTTVRALSGQTSALNRVQILSGLWNNTASLTTITLTHYTGANFVVGSRFSLYGIKG